MSEWRLMLLACRQPFNHGVEGSSPSALTNNGNKINSLQDILKLYFITIQL
jgi:hypothetical protein